jgi:hypothetical protein
MMLERAILAGRGIATDSTVGGSRQKNALPKVLRVCPASGGAMESLLKGKQELLQIQNLCI